MNLRVNLALTSYRQIDITVRPGLGPVDLERLIYAIADQTHGYHDEVRIRSLEELPVADEEEVCDAAR